MVVIGATNRPKDVDTAILRRMPLTFKLGLPDLGQRKEILSAVLRMERVSECVNMLRLAKLTEVSHVKQAEHTESCQPIRTLNHVSQ